MEVPEDIRAQGSWAVNEYERGYYHARRLGAWYRVMNDCGPSGLSQLPQGDGRGAPQPGWEVFTWPEKGLCFVEPELFHEGGFWV